MRVVYHTHYLVWFEIGRTELMRELGCAYGALEEQDGIFFPVREVGARYLSPARYDEVLEVHTSLESMGGASMRFEYRVLRRDGGRLLASGFTEHAAVGPAGRPVRLPVELRRRLVSGAARR
jgi:acyl-CoA thioester hydrolase